jgi:hypothetical protein
LKINWNISGTSLMPLALYIFWNTGVKLWNIVVEHMGINWNTLLILELLI